MNSISLIINKVIIIGIDRDYECEFREGLNFIWGDMDSGKSSILNLIDYCLGGKFNELDYDELRRKGRSAILEASFNGKIVSFERILSDNENIIKVYNSEASLKESVYPKICSASSSGVEPDGWISDIILDLLSIPKVMIKESKIREDSNSQRLSFRDLMKLIYLRQKKVASEGLMDSNNGVVHNKNIEVQKFTYGVHDDQLAELQNELALELQQLKTLEIKILNIKEFLSSTDSRSINDDEIDEIEVDIKQLDAEIEKLLIDKNHASIISSNIARKIEDFIQQSVALAREITEIKQKTRDYSRLYATYKHDLSCLKSSSRVREILGENGKCTQRINCPLCKSVLAANDSTVSDEDIRNESRSISNRIAGCKSSLEKLKSTLVEKISLKNSIDDHVNTLRIEFDRNNIESLSPTIQSIRKIERTRSTLQSHLSIFNKNKRLIEKIEEYVSDLDRKQLKISNIKRDIEEVESNLKDISDVYSDLALYFSQIIRKSKLTNNYGVDISNKFMPIFRNREYNRISSGGVRTILSVSLYLSRLIYLINNGGYLPTLLLIDTPGQNIGRYARGRDTDDLSDPSIYEQIYLNFLQIQKLASEKNKKFQVIVVDNDLPNCLNNAQYHLVKRFDKSNIQYEKGLINDA